MRPREVFVIMPFSATQNHSDKEWTEIFEHVFRPAILQAGYSCRRVAPTTGSVAKSIIDSLKHSWVVMADITDRNANVFYELGVRHALSNRTIVVTQNGSDSPSDLKGYWWLEYGTSPASVSGFAREIARILRAISTDPDRSDNPVSDYLAEHHLVLEGIENSRSLRLLESLRVELTGLYQAISQAVSEQVWTPMPIDSLSHLLVTRAVNLPVAVWRQLYEIRLAAGRLNHGATMDQTSLYEIAETVKEAANTLDQARRQMASGDYVSPEERECYLEWKRKPNSAGIGCYCFRRHPARDLPRLSELTKEMLQSIEETPRSELSESDGGRTTG